MGRMRAFPLSVRATGRIRRSSWFSSRLTKPLLKSRSTAVLINPGVRNTLGPECALAEAIAKAVHYTKSPKETRHAGHFESRSQRGIITPRVYAPVVWADRDIAQRRS